MHLILERNCKFIERKLSRCQLEYVNILQEGNIRKYLLDTQNLRVHIWSASTETLSAKVKMCHVLI